jgi:hypothetical protein
MAMDCAPWPAKANHVSITLRGRCKAIAGAELMIAASAGRIRAERKHIARSCSKVGCRARATSLIEASRKCLRAVGAGTCEMYHCVR